MKDTRRKVSLNYRRLPILGIIATLHSQGLNVLPLQTLTAALLEEIAQGRLTPRVMSGEICLDWPLFGVMHRATGLPFRPLAPLDGTSYRLEDVPLRHLEGLAPAFEHVPYITLGRAMACYNLGIDDFSREFRLFLDVLRRTELPSDTSDGVILVCPPSWMGDHIRKTLEAPRIMRA